MLQEVRRSLGSQDGQCSTSTFKESGGECSPLEMLESREITQRTDWRQCKRLASRKILSFEQFEHLKKTNTFYFQFCSIHVQTNAIMIIIIAKTNRNRASNFTHTNTHIHTQTHTHTDRHIHPPPSTHTHTHEQRFLVCCLSQPM